MEPAIVIGSIQIKCDSCDYRAPITREDADVWLNKPCPACGANLLTEADLNAMKLTLSGVDLINLIYGPVKDGAKRMRVETNPRG